MHADPINVIITGVGGQGNILASSLVAQAAIEEGWLVTIGETHGASQRGGSVMSHVRLSRKFQVGPLIPKSEAHIIVGFEPMETLRVAIDYANPDTKVIVNPRPTFPLGVQSGLVEYPEVEKILSTIKGAVGEVRVLEATELAREKGVAIAQNVVMVGALAGSGFLPVKPESFRKALYDTFKADKLELNLGAFESGSQSISQTDAA